MISFFLFVIFTTITADKSVKYAAIVFRHGDRTPTDTYPSDPWRNESLWPVGFGQLTNTGKRQHYALGKWLKQRYSHLLSNDYNPLEIYIQSTDVDRTLMSAEANLAGMFPPTNHSTWNTDLKWQPIPVHTVPVEEDEVLAMKKPCQAFDKELDRFRHSQSYRQNLSKYQHLMDYISSYTGLKIQDYYDIEDIYSTLYIERLYNFTLPNWTQSIFPDKMREPACHSFTTQTGTPLLARLKVGPLIKQITARMLASLSKKTKKPKVVMYSGHDLTIGSLLNALGLYDGNCPDYTSTIIFELLENSKCQGDNLVRISYRNTPEIVEPKVLTIPFCGETCPLERFIKLYDNLISVKWEKECNKQFPAVLGGSLIIGIFVVIYISHKIHFSQGYRPYRYSPDPPSSTRICQPCNV